MIVEVFVEKNTGEIVIPVGDSYVTPDGREVLPHRVRRVTYVF